MTEVEQVIVGQEAETKDLYLHFLDVQTHICLIWRFSRMHGWERVVQALSELEDLMLMATEDPEHPLIMDIRWLTLIAAMHVSADRARRAEAAA